MSDAQPLHNYVAGTWTPSSHGEQRPVHDPATAEVIATVTLTPAEEVARAVEAAHEAQRAWHDTPVVERTQPLFRFKALLEEHIEEIGRIIVRESGKTLPEAVGELRRGIENVEVACGAPMLMQGVNNEDIARGIDEHMFRQPLGVVAGITPFNFPGMIPLWFLPYAVATGNAFVLKPSEQDPVVAERIFELVDRAGFPDGVVQHVHGGVMADLLEIPSLTGHLDNLRRAPEALHDREIGLAALVRVRVRRMRHLEETGLFATADEVVHALLYETEII